MKNQIIDKLKEVEQYNNVEILFAVESGSRAWGFASPDSDYDIRFVYKKQTKDYLNLWDEKDTIEFMIAEDLDGSGWDLKKATKLLAKSNASFLGWLFSPIVYIDQEGIINRMRELAQNNFNPIAGFHHFHSMNHGFNKKLFENDFTIKEYFYAMRTALCANWILKNQTIPPVEFRKLFELIDSKESDLLESLMLQKNQTDEAEKVQIDVELIQLASRISDENQRNKNSLKNKKANFEEFNSFFTNEVL